MRNPGGAYGNLGAFDELNRVLHERYNAIVPTALRQCIRIYTGTTYPVHDWDHIGHDKVHPTPVAAAWMARLAWSGITGRCVEIADPAHGANASTNSSESCLERPSTKRYWWYRPPRARNGGSSGGGGACGLLQRNASTMLQKQKVGKTEELATTLATREFLSGLPHDSPNSAF